MASDGLRQVVINVSARDFTIKCSDDFANFLEDDISLISGGTNKIELKNFVNAFVQKSHENYILKRDMKRLVNTIDNNFQNKK